MFCVLILFAFLVGGSFIIGGHASGAERSEPIRIGALTDSWGPTPGVAGLRDGLVELGYRENEDFFIGVRFAQGNVRALPKAARELVQQDVDIIFTSDPVSTKAAQQATSKIPIVFSAAGNPLGLGFIQNFAHPGGNLTGVTDLDLELDAKRLQIFAEIVPRLKQVLFPYNPSDAFARAQARSYGDAARRLNVTLIDKPIRTSREARETISNIRRGEVDGILTPHSVSSNIPGLAIEATSRRHIPTMFNLPWFVEHGGMVSYGADVYESGRMAARLVHKILRGESPAEIPVEVNQKVQFVINLKVLGALGIRIGPEILYRANRVLR